MISDEAFDALKSFLSQVEVCVCSKPSSINTYPFRYRDKATIDIGKDGVIFMSYAICGQVYITKENLDYVVMDKEHQTIELKSSSESDHPFDKLCKTFHLVLYEFKGKRPTVGI